MTHDFTTKTLFTILFLFSTTLYPNFYLKAQTQFEKDSIQVENSLANAALFLQEGKVADAQALAEASFDLAQRLDSKSLMKKVSYSLSEIFSQKGDSAKTFLFLAQAYHYHYSDSIQKSDINQHLAVEKYAREMATMRYQQARQMYIWIIIVLAILGLSLAGYVWARIEKNKILERTAAEIKEQNRQLEASLEVQRQFAHAAAHDLKEPLRNIGSFFNIIQKRYGREIPPEAADYFGFVNHGIKRMDNLLNALLDYSSISTDDKQTTHMTDVKSIVLDVLSFFEEDIAAKKATIRYPSVLPTVRLNPNHVKQILRNLFANALKFNEQNPTIQLDFQVKKKEFVFAMRDNGIGIKEDYRHKIYHLFQQLDRSSRYEGTGVGLTICKNIVEKYNGRIWFEANADGAGTVFYVAFPKTYLIFDEAELEYTYEIEANSKKMKDLVA